MTFSETITLLKHDLRGYAEPFWKAAIFIPVYLVINTLFTIVCAIISTSIGTLSLCL